MSPVSLLPMFPVRTGNSLINLGSFTLNQSSGTTWKKPVMFSSLFMTAKKNTV